MYHKRSRLSARQPAPAPENDHFLILRKMSLLTSLALKSIKIRLQLMKNGPVPSRDFWLDWHRETILDILHGVRSDVPL